MIICGRGAICNARRQSITNLKITTLMCPFIDDLEHVSWKVIRPKGLTGLSVWWKLIMVLFISASESLWYMSLNIYHYIYHEINYFDDMSFTQSYLVNISLLMCIACIISYLYVACN